jgi:phosphoadenosine phosphosulfate reductase
MSREMRESTAALESMTAERRLRWAAESFPRDEIIVTSSFGADSAVLLHLVRTVVPDFRVAMIDTGFLFPETLAYMHRLTDEFGLNIERVRAPSPPEGPPAEACGEEGGIWCACRKVEAMEQALRGVSCWISGLRRDQSSQRAQTPVLERQQGGLVKLHPLADWSQEQLSGYQQRFAPPQHPLVEQGYSSIGCMPCTRLPVAGDDRRSGRWRGQARTECGIHSPRRFSGAVG